MHYHLLLVTGLLYWTSSERFGDGDLWKIAANVRLCGVTAVFLCGKIKAYLSHVHTQPNADLAACIDVAEQFVLTEHQTVNLFQPV